MANKEDLQQIHKLVTIMQSQIISISENVEIVESETGICVTHDDVTQFLKDLQEEIDNG